MLNFYVFLQLFNKINHLNYFSLESIVVLTPPIKSLKIYFFPNIITNLKILNLRLVIIFGKK